MSVFPAAKYMPAAFSERWTRTTHGKDSQRRVPQAPAVESTCGASITLQNKDEAILKNVREALDQSGYDQLRKLSVYCHRGRIVLQGGISTYFLKQVAQEIALAIDDVLEIDNDLKVLNANCH